MPIPRSTIAIASGLTAGYLGAGLLPEVVDLYQAELRLSATAAGLVAAVLLGSTAVAGLVVAGRLRQAAPVRLAALGLKLAVLGYTGAALAIGVWWLSAAVTVAGFGGGMALAASTSALSAGPDPDRSTGQALFIKVLVTALLLLLLPLVTDGSAPVGFLSLAAVCLVCLPLVRWLPSAPSSVARGPLTRHGLGLVLLIAVVLMEAGEIGSWTLVDEIGINAVGIQPAEVGLILSIGLLAGLVGVAGQTWIGARWGRAVPVVGLLLAQTVCRTVLLTNTSPVVFAAAQWIWSATYYALFACVLVLGAEMDGLGRWAALVAAGVAIGDSVGPLVAGVIVDRGGLGTLAVVSAVAGAITVVLLGGVAHTFDRNPTSAPSPGS